MDTLLSINATALAEWVVQKFSKDDPLTNWASLMTVIGVLGGLGAYFLDIRREKQRERKEEHAEQQRVRDEEKAERDRAYANLTGELLDAFNGLDRIKFNSDAKSFVIPKTGQQVFYMNRSLNHDFYDSLIYSGKINFLEQVLQQEMQDIFRRIKLHNEYLKLVLKQFEDNNNKIPDVSYKYYIWMDKTEVRLRKEIPHMINKLDEHFNPEN